MSGLPTTAERVRATNWLEETFRPDAPFGPARFPASFRCGDRESAALLKDWTAEWGPETAEAGRSRRTLTLTDPRGGLRCRCELTTFADFPAFP